MLCQAINRENRIKVPSNLPFGFRSAMRWLRSTTLTRFPTIWRVFHRNRALAVACQNDPATNAKTTLPPDEFIDLCCVWGVEFYTPAYMESLIDNLEKLGWRQREGSSTPAEWVGQVPGRGVRVRHPDCTTQAAVDCVSETSCSASCFVVTPGVR